MEENVLVGGQELIRKTRPLLYVENDRRYKSESLITQIFSLGYRAYWHPVPMYNPNNYNQDRENIFGDIHSLNMLCLPVESSINVENLTEVLDARYHPLD